MNLECPVCKAIINAPSLAECNNRLYDHINDLHPERRKEFLSDEA